MVHSVVSPPFSASFVAERKELNVGIVYDALDLFLVETGKTGFSLKK